MSRGREVTADTLNDIVGQIRSRQYTGWISIERISSEGVEEGTLYFNQGRPTFAHTGSASGQTALAQLMEWRQILIRFPEHMTPPTSSTESDVMAAVSPTAPISLGPRTSFSPSVPSQPSASHMFSPAMPARQLESLARPPLSQSAGAISEYALAPGRELLVPRKFDSSQDVLSLPLTRPQRSIYLLIDGKRTIADLARTTRKSLQEIVRLLNELHAQDLIVY